MVVILIATTLYFKNGMSAQMRRQQEALDAQTRSFEAQIRGQQEAIDRQLQIAQQQYRILANESLEKNVRSLQETNTTQLNSLLSPLRMRIEDFNRSIAQNHTDATASRRSLADQIRNLTELNLSIGNEARNLAGALRGNTRVQGRWGETLLETLLEKAGLKKGVNFDTQVTRDASGQTLRDEQGRAMRPDMVVLLPDERCIIIDSKTSLSAYLDYCEAETPEVRQEALKRHTQSVRKHVDELSAKGYLSGYKGAVEQILMFIPNDAAMIAALEGDGSLIEYAADRKISIVSPTQLMSVLMLVAQIWRKENQDRNAAEIAKLGGLLYDSVESFLKDFQGIETSLKKATDSYHSAMGKLTTGPRSLVSRAERMKQMGAKTSKTIPTPFLNAGLGAMESSDQTA